MTRIPLGTASRLLAEPRSSLATTFQRGEQHHDKMVSTITSLQNSAPTVARELTPATAARLDSYPYSTISPHPA